jgi:hypothetical protein
MNTLEGKPPKDPHLIVWTSKSGINAMPLPKGCMMGIVLDPTRPDEFSRMLLVEIRPSRLVFRCTCDSKCTTVFTYRLETSGKHPKRK